MIIAKGKIAGRVTTENSVRAETTHRARAKTTQRARAREST